MKVKKLLALVLCLLLTVSLLPVSAWAEGEDPAAPALTSDPTDPQTDPELGDDLEDPVADADDDDPPAPAEPQNDGPAAKDGDVLADGFYLIGPDWTISAINSNNRFGTNPANASEYMLATTLTQGQKIKVVKVANNAITNWYPDGVNNEYTVDASHAGSTTIYFQETYKSDWSGFGGYFYVAEATAPAQTYTIYQYTSRHGTVSVKNASNETVTTATAGTVLHLDVAAETGYVATTYKIYLGSPGGSSTEYSINDTFTMPASNIYYSVFYRPIQSGYYWRILNSNGPVLTGDDMIASQVLSFDGVYYTAPVRFNSIGWLNVRYYDADTHKVGDNYRLQITSAETGSDRMILFNPNVGGDEIHIGYPITVVQPQHGTISTLSGAGKNWSVTVNATPDDGYRFDSLTVTDANGNPVAASGSSFNMPDSSVTVTATFVPDVAHAIHVVSKPHGTTTVSTGSYQNVTEAQARKDAFVTVNVTPDQGYKKGSLTVLPSATGGVIPGLSKTDTASSTFFYMPDQDVWVSVSYIIANAGYYLCFKEDGRQVGTSFYYSIPESAIDPRNLYEDASGSMYLTVAVPAAWAGKEAWTTYVNGNGEVWNLDTQNGNGVTVPTEAAGTTVRFLFQLTNRVDNGYPKYVTGTTTLENSYGITAAATTNGTLLVASSAFAGDTVTVTATPANGYYLRRLTVTDASNNPVTVTNGAFTMPAGPVTVTATFAQKVALSDGFYIVPADAADLSGALPMTNRSDVIERLFSYTGNLTAGTYSLVKVIGHAPVEYYYQDENCYVHQTTELPFTVASSGTQTVYIKASDTVVNGSTEVYVTPKCTSLTGLYCWASAVHDWEFASIKASDAFVYDSETGFYIAGIRLSGYDLACVVELSNGNFVQSYPANAFPNYTAGNNVFYVADGDEFGYGSTIPAVMYYRADGQGDAADGWQQGCLKAERQYDVVVNPYTHGTVTVSKTAGLLIGLTVEPDAGYRLSSLTVVDADNNPIAVTHSEDMATLYEFRIASSNAYVTVQFTEDADYYVYTQAMANGNTLPGAAYKMAYVYDNTAEIGYYRFVQKNLLAVGDSIHIVKVENGAITAHYPSDSYWMPLTAENLDDESTGTEIGFRPEGFVNTSFANDTALVFENGSANKLFYKCLYATIVINSHSITLVADAAACTVAGLPESADAGATVTFTVTPADGRKVTSVKVAWNDGNEAHEQTLTPGDAGSYTFTMPAYNVTVTVTTGYVITVRVGGVAANIQYSLWAFSDDYVILQEGQTPADVGGEEITDNAVPVGKYLGLYVTFNGAQKVEYSISYDSNGNRVGSEGTITPEANLRLTNTVDEGPVIITLTVDPVRITLFNNFGGNEESYLGAAPVTTTIPDNPFTRPGYVFQYWTEEMDGSGTLYMPGQEVTLNTDFALWAQWALEDGYYLLGNMHQWNVNNLTPADRFTPNTQVNGEYLLTHTFDVGTDAFKVVELENGQIKNNTYYGTARPNHADNDGNYVIGDQTGTKTVYFRPVWNNEWDGHIYLGGVVAPWFNGHSLLLTGQIGVQFFMNLPGGPTAYPNSYMTISGNKVDGEYHYAEPKVVDFGGGDIRYAYTVFISSVQMADKFTPVFHYFVDDEEITITGDPYAAEDYIQWGLAHPEGLDGKALAVVRALADYGYYAQRSLSKVNGWTIGEKYAEMTTKVSDSFDYNVVSAAVAQYEVDRSVLDGLNFRVVFSSLTNLEMRFKTVEGAEVKLDGTTVTPNVSGAYSVVTVKGIKATGLTQSYTLQVGETSVNISPMSYVQVMLGSTSANTDDDLRNLLCAFYYYGVACAAYKN